MNDVNAGAGAADGPPIVVGPLTEADAAAVDHLIEALATGNFDPFNSALSPDRMRPFLPDQRAAFLRGEREMFERFARRVERGPSVIFVNTQHGDRRLVLARLRVRGAPATAADLAIARQDAAGPTLNGLVQLSPGLPEQPVDPADKSRIDEIVAALVMGDWSLFRKLTSEPQLPEDHGRGSFEMFSHKVGRLKRIDCRINQADQRFLTLLLGARTPDGRDLTLQMLARGRGTETTFGGALLQEAGFDRSGFEREQRRIANRKSAPPPPWKAHPDIPRGSIGWRMGGGEGSLINFSEFYSELSDAERAQFELAYPEPEEWAGFYRLLRGERARN